MHKHVGSRIAGPDLTDRWGVRDQLGRGGGRVPSRIYVGRVLGAGAGAYSGERRRRSVQASYEVVTAAPRVWVMAMQT